MTKNLCNNVFKLNKAKVKKIHMFTGLVLGLSTFTGSLTAYAESFYTIKVVIDDGKEYELKTPKKTVSKFLKYEDIDLSPEDKINVNPDEVIDEDMSIKINRAYTIKLTVDGKLNVYKARDIKVSDLLKRENINVYEKDIVSVPVDTLIDKDMDIEVNRAEKVKFVVDNKEEIPFIVNNARVGVAVNEFMEETGKQVYLEEGQSSAADVKDGMIIKVASLKEEIKVTKQEIPFETKTVENSNLLEGTTNVKTKGENGIKEIKTKEIYKKDELQSQEIIEEKVTKQPITEIIEKGTKKKFNTIKTEKGTFVVNNKINMKSTAYTAGMESTGKKPGDEGYGLTASGMKAKKGIVAVDTSIIPFGTELYIEGYGYAIAGDTGSAIKGNKIDVFLDDYEDAKKYGVRNVNVYVLGDKVA